MAPTLRQIAVMLREIADTLPDDPSYGLPGVRYDFRQHLRTWRSSRETGNPLGALGPSDRQKVAAAYRYYRRMREAPLEIRVPDTNCVYRFPRPCRQALQAAAARAEKQQRESGAKDPWAASTTPQTIRELIWVDEDLEGAMELARLTGRLVDGLYIRPKQNPDRLVVIWDRVRRVEIPGLEEFEIYSAQCPLTTPDKNHDCLYVKGAHGFALADQGLKEKTPTLIKYVRDRMAAGVDAADIIRREISASAKVFDASKVTMQ